MGQKSSTSPLTSITSPQFQQSRIPEFIANSKDLAFALGRKLNLVGHTTIVAVFDGVPRFTIDFGVTRKMAAKAALCYKAPGTVVINDFDSEQIKIEFLMENHLKIETEFRKDIAANLFDVLLNIPVQAYDLLEYNCRNYVTAAVLVIRVFAAQNWEKFDWDCVDLELLKQVAAVFLEKSDDPEMVFLRDVTKNDDIKLKKGTNIVAGTLGGLGGTLAVGGGAALAGVSAAATVGCATGGAGLVAGALAISIPILIKIAKKRLSQNQMRKDEDQHKH